MASKQILDYLSSLQVPPIIQEQPAIAILSLTFGGFALLWIYRLYFHPLSSFPGPPIAACSSFYFMYHIWTGYFPQHCEKLFKKYNSDVLRVAPNQLVFNDPQALKDIPGRSDVYRGNFALRVIGFTGQTVSNIRDPGEHRRKRRVMAPGFSNTALAEQEPHIVVPIVNKLVERIKEAKGNPINMSVYFDCTTSDIIGKLSFGADFGMLDKMEDHPFLHVLPNVLRLSVIAQCIPELYRAISWANRVGPKWTIPKSVRAVADFAGYHLAERKKRDAEEVDKTGRKDIISIIESGNQKYEGMEGYAQLGEFEMIGEATTLVTGGGDTVATALTLTMFHIGQHPEVYKRLVSEIRGAFSSFDEINGHVAGNKLKYLDAVLNESMRVSPVLPGPMWRRTDHSIAVAGHVVPSRTEIGAMRYNIFRNSKAFHDPDAFKPERWMQDMGDDLSASQPFGLGPRTCIGRNIAWMELRLIMCKLLWQFDWTPVTKTYQNPEYLVQYRGPMLMKAKVRS